ncbi:DGQHR domain-containing protein [Sulfurimonas indica]|uniref:DGQHR domain-containing protein n=1 Tax=Sulfurimonas indica TaxID=2508707 RepID=UPI001264987F|nr:DGQHR domain-containing protein [Sulfurimonas indica]
MKTIDLIKISQIGAKDMYIGKIYYNEIKNNVILTKRIGSEGKLFQRETDKRRVNDIANYLFDLEEASKTDFTPVIPFATPLILSFDTANLEDYEENIDNYLQSNEALPILKNDRELILPKNSYFKILIVDGQHRFRGVERFLEKSTTNNDFEFFATFLFDYDLYEQSQVFANINFKQKPVNKSLFYDIFGSIPDIKNELTFAHYLAKTLNKSSHLNGLIKMLGNGPGTVSLAFFVETVIDELINIKGNLYSIYNEYEVYEEPEEENIVPNFKKIPNILTDYFRFFENHFPDYYPKTKLDGTYSSYQYKYYLLKSPGVYALLKIFNDIFPKINIEEYKQEIFEKQLKEIFKNISQNPKIYFDNENFKGTGSKALQKKLYEHIYNALVL